MTNLATTAKMPSTMPDATPITGPITVIISLGDTVSGIESIIAASSAWLAMYRPNNRICDAVIHTLFNMLTSKPCRKYLPEHFVAMM
jgi:hypothetical protein